MAKSKGECPQPLKYFGGQSYLASKYHEIASPYKWSKENQQGWLHRVITHAGGLGEFWGWDFEGVSEVVNDIDGDLMRFYKILRDEPAAFISMVQFTPFSESLWRSCKEYFSRKPKDRDRSEVEEAWMFFVLVRQSMMGMQKSFAPLSRTRVRRGMNEQVSAWLTAVEGLPQVHERLSRVVILNEDYKEVLKENDGPNTLFFMDPPYVPTTRTKGAYKFEMTEINHHELVDITSRLRGFCMICGYENDIYKRLERSGWVRHTFEVANAASKSASKKVMNSCLWENFSLVQTRNNS